MTDGTDFSSGRFHMDVHPHRNRQAFVGRLLVLFSSVTACAAATVAFIGCQSTPITERRQLVLMSEAEEKEMGLTAYQQVLEEEKPMSDGDVTAIVRRVGERIAGVANRPDFQWEFNVIDSPTQNAFCLPGGKVAVYTGIIPVCRNEAGLAVVMSHEIGHAIARHGGERMTHQMIQNKAKEGVAYVMRKKEETSQQIVLTAYNAGSEYLGILPYSRKHELEADHIGLMLMAKAGYDPSEAPEFWERFAGEKEGAAPMEFLSTHPSDAHRSAALRELLPKAMEYYQAAPEKLGSGQDIEGIARPKI